MPRWPRPGLAGYVPVDDRPYAPRDPDAYADLLCRIHPIGTPDDCLQTMTATIEHTGFRHLILMVEGAGHPHWTQENIARLGADVLPRLKARFDDSRPALSPPIGQ